MLPGDKERNISRSKEEIENKKICIFVLSLPNLIGQSREKDLDYPVKRLTTIGTGFAMNKVG